MSSEFMRRAYMMKVAEEDEVVAKALYPYAECALDNAFGVIKEDINAAPDVDAVPVVHGHWEIAIGYDPQKSFQCSECSLMSYEPTDYCPHCGAKMDEVSE